MSVVAVEAVGRVYSQMKMKMKTKIKTKMIFLFFALLV